MIRENVHVLKCMPHFFDPLDRGDMTFAIRRNDRRYQVGDVLIHREYDPAYGFTGREVKPLVVTYVLMDEDFPALLPGFVIMGLRPRGESE